MQLGYQERRPAHLASQKRSVIPCDRPISNRAGREASWRRLRHPRLLANHVRGCRSASLPMRDGSHGQAVGSRCRTCLVWDAEVACDKRARQESATRELKRPSGTKRTTPNSEFVKRDPNFLGFGPIPTPARNVAADRSTVVEKKRLGSRLV